MSSIAITGGATGTGVFSLLAPSTSTNRTLTLPDATDTVAGIAATQTLTNKTLTSPTLTTPNINSAQVATVSGTAPLYMCRAWVNFNGQGTVAIRSSGNVSSITDNGTGDYTINFTTAMPDTSYCFSGVAEPGTGATNYTVWGAGSSSSFVRTVSTIRVRTGYINTLSANSVVTDPDVINVAIFR